MEIWKWIALGAFIFLFLYAINSIQVTSKQIIFNLNYTGLNYPLLLFGSMVIIAGYFALREMK